MKPGQFSFVGLKNYERFLFRDPLTPIVFNATLVITLGSLVLSILIGLATAMVMKSKTNRFIRSVIITPYAIPTVVVSLITLWIIDPTYGILTYVVHLFTGVKVNMLSNPTLALITILCSFVWKYYPFSTLVLLAALESVPKQFYEAAEIDGASSIQRFIHVTIPSIKPTLLLLILLLTISGFQCFDVIYMVTSGGPSNATNNLVIYTYQNAFTFYRMSYASAIGIFSTFIMLIISILYLRLLGKRE